MGTERSVFLRWALVAIRIRDQQCLEGMLVRIGLDFRELGLLMFSVAKLSLVIGLVLMVVGNLVALAGVLLVKGKSSLY
jgi:hypothetical protein